MEEGKLKRADVRPVELIDTKNPEHGDFACNFAMMSAKAFGCAPRMIADPLAAKMAEDPIFSSVSVAGPGFINMSIDPGAIAGLIGDVLDSEGSSPMEAGHFGHTKAEDAKRINVEFVSVNPNGPITIGSGRGAAYGSALCNVLQAAGNDVHREYYINDGVNSEQMRLFAESVKAMADGNPLPEGGYKGDYVDEVAKQISHKGGEPVDWWQQQAQELMLAAQHSALTAFGVEFDTWFSEQSLHDSNQVEACINQMVEQAVADEDPVQHEWKAEAEAATGAYAESAIPPASKTAEFGLISQEQENTNSLWLRSTKFGDEKDRVLRRQDGRLTYIASDVAYHKDKFNRPVNADKLITVLGPDHHGYIGRLQAVVAALFRDGADTKENNEKALALAKERLEVQIFQLVRFMKDGKPSPMRKRDGNIYALIDLINEIGEQIKPDGSTAEKQEVGKDVARFFYLMRSHDTTFDFDLDLARSQSDENPVFYVQYAHARICSVIAKAAEAKITPAVNTALLTHPREKALMIKILDLPHETARCAEDYSVNRLATYAIELGRTYHHFYDVCRVIQPDEPELSQARLALCVAAKTALKGVFDILGISAPERMDRAPAEEKD